MANDFVIKITAVDRATKTVEKVNSAVGKIFQPYENAKRSTRSFFDALGKNDLVAKPVWALNKLGSGAASVATSFGIAETSVLGSTARMAASISSIGGPLGAFAAGGLVLAGATTAIGVRMAKMGFDVDRTAKNLGMTTERLQEYRGAAKLAGMESQTMDAALGGLSGRLVDIAANRDLQGAALLGHMRITLRRTKDGAIDTATALRDISNVISKIPDAQQQLKIADMLGVGDLLPLLRQGGAEIDKLIKKARDQGLVMSQDAVNANKRQADSWNETKGAIDGAGTSLGNLVAQYAHLDRLAKNSTGIAGWLKDWSDKRVDANKQDDKRSPAFTPATIGLRMGGLPGATVGGLYDMFTGINRLVGPKPQPAGGGRGFVNNLPGVSPPAGPLPRGIRNNNPGNLNFAGQAGAVVETGPKARFAVFATPEEGLTAMAKNLVAYQEKYGIRTIESAISRWAPAKDNNNTTAYISSVSRQTGIKSDETLNLRDPATLAPLISAMIKHENKGQNPYSAEMIASAADAAAQRAQGGGAAAAAERPIRIVVEGLPAGTSVKAVRGLGQPAVGLTMQPGGTS